LAGICAGGAPDVATDVEVWPLLTPPKRFVVKELRAKVYFYRSQRKINVKRCID